MESVPRLCADHGLVHALLGAGPRPFLAGFLLKLPGSRMIRPRLVEAGSAPSAAASMRLSTSQRSPETSSARRQ
jgi:hypothetical protein